MTLDELRDEVAGHMDEIVALFKPGVKITVVVRTPGFPDRDMLMTDDDLAEVRAMIERRASLVSP